MKLSDSSASSPSNLNENKSISLQKSSSWITKSSASGPNIAKPRYKYKRERSHRACDTCHKRKVRCDLIYKNYPLEKCTNCQEFGVDCVVSERKRRRTKKEMFQARKFLENKLSNLKQPEQKEEQKDTQNQAPIQKQKQSTQEVRHLSESPLIQANDIEYNQESIKDTGDAPIKLEFNRVLHCEKQTVTTDSPSSTSTLPASISKQTLTSLTITNCFTLPSKSKCELYLDTFWENFNSVYPFLSFAAFNDIKSQLQSPKSLVLLRCMLFAGAKSLDVKPDTDDLFEKARLCLDANLESDEFYLCISYFILVSCGGSTRLQRSNMVGLQSYAQIVLNSGFQNSNFTLEEQQCRRRFFWILHAFKVTSRFYIDVHCRSTQNVMDDWCDGLFYSVMDESDPCILFLEKDDVISLDPDNEDQRKYLMIWLCDRASDLTICVYRIHEIFKIIENFSTKQDLRSMVDAMPSIDKHLNELDLKFTINTAPSVDESPLIFLVRSAMFSVKCHLQLANLTKFYALLIDMIENGVSCDIQCVLFFDLTRSYQSMFDSVHQQARLLIKSMTILRGKIPFLQIPLGRTLKTCVMLLPFRYHTDPLVRSLTRDDLQNLFPVIQEIQRFSSNEIVLSYCVILLNNNSVDLNTSKEIIESKMIERFFCLLFSTNKENSHRLQPPFLSPLVSIPEQCATGSEEIRQPFMSHNRHFSYPFPIEIPTTHTRNIYHTPTKSSPTVPFKYISPLFDPSPTSSSSSSMSRFSSLPSLVPPALFDKRQQSQLTASSESYSHPSGISSISGSSTLYPLSATTSYPLSSAVSASDGRSIFSKSTPNTSTSLSSTSIRSIDSPHYKQSMDFVTDKTSLISLGEESEQTFRDNQSLHQKELPSLNSMLETPPTTSTNYFEPLEPMVQAKIDLTTGNYSDYPQIAVPANQKTSILASSVVPIIDIQILLSSSSHPQQ
ncbi:unnamed protein product [Ambrosiozyma monospora]|uniref:Unnamed protein product n=1 Tax=Ambrosiozyma monospora TaxID=43982 RepID=A0A9W6YYH3_AMBMO|nr:unnamed protein product [Ambrosiozyma monospora]